MTSPPRAAPLFKLTFAALLIALAFASTYTSSASAFSDADLKDILEFGGAVAAAPILKTVLDVVHALLRCLSGGESALAKPRNRSIFFGPAKGQDLSIFEEYLYE